MKPGVRQLLFGSGVSDPDARAYIAQVRAAGGVFPSGATATVNTLFAGLKADGVWSKITDMHVIGGVNTLAGVMVPMKSSVPVAALTYTNFLQSDYIATGPDMGLNDYDNMKYHLNGSGGSVTLKTLSIGTPTLQTLSAYGVWGSSRSGVGLMNPTTTAFPSIFANSETVAAADLYSFGGADFLSATGRVAGDVMAIRQASNSARMYINGTSAVTLSSASVSTPGGGEIVLLAGGAGATGAKRHTGYFIAPGASYVEALLIRSRIQTALNSLGYATGITTQLGIGDSITAGFNGATSYLTYLKSMSGWTGGRYVNTGRNSAQLLGSLGMNDQYSKLAKPLRPDSYYSTRGLAFVMAGTNDLKITASTAADVLTGLRTMWAALRTDGFRVIAGTIPPRADAGWTGAMETERTSLNTSILADSANWDAVVPWHTILPDSSDLTYYQADKLHPNSAGEALVAAWILANINPATV